MPHVPLYNVHICVVHVLIEHGPSRRLHPYSRVILKCNGEYIYTPPLYLCFAAKKRPPPLVSVSPQPALDPPPSQVLGARRKRQKFCENG